MTINKEDIYKSIVFIIIAGIAVFLIMGSVINILIILLFISGLYFFNDGIHETTFFKYAANLTSSRKLSILNQVQSIPVKKVKGYSEFIKNNPDFDEEKFKIKIDIAFRQIHEALNSQNLSTVRKFISDGMYQRFNTQFKLMKLLKLKSFIEKVWIRNLYIARIETDGLFDIIHIGILIKKIEHITCKIDSSLNSDRESEFIEFWSFLKKRGIPYHDLYSTDECPQCGSTLSENMGEISKCESCGSLLNSGQYDWILSEITQSDDFNMIPYVVFKNPFIKEKIKKVVSENEDFSVQLIEDKAGNAYLQIASAIVMNEPAIMRRFVNDHAFEKIKKQMHYDNFLYSSLFLNDVSLIGVSESENKNILFIAVKSSYQRVKLTKGTVIKLDEMIMSKNVVLVMSRDKGAKSSPYSLYAHTCPKCGGPLQDTLDILCTYCGSILNSTAHEWIVTDILSMSEYKACSKSDNKSIIIKSHESVDSLYSVRDYAFNNVMVMIGVDGIFDDKEKIFAYKLAKKWGYNTDRLKCFFDMAINLKLVIRMPENHKKKKQIFELMQKTAQIDGPLSPIEQRLLDSIQKEYKIR